MELERPSDNIGKRVAFYRQMNGMSAADLSERTNGAISKGVIANIETGRKRDLTVDELVALSWALDVPPVALALPIESPNSQVKIAEGKDELYSVTVGHAARWFVSPATPWRADFKSTMQNEGYPSGALAASRANALFRWRADLEEEAKLRRRIRLAKQLGEETETFEEQLAEVEKALEQDVQQMSLYRMNVKDDG